MQFNWKLERNMICLEHKSFGVRSWELGLRTEVCVYLTIGLFIIVGQPSASHKVNGKDRILNEGKDKIAEGKGNIDEIELQNLYINSISGTVARDSLQSPAIGFPSALSW